MRREMVFETLVFSSLNHLTWLIARENFIIMIKMIKISKERENKEGQKEIEMIKKGVEEEKERWG
jgi:hypothetical protein